MNKANCTTSGHAALLPRRAIAMVFVLGAMVNLLMLTGSIYMLQVYDRVLASRSIETLLGLFGIVVLLYLFLGLFDFLRQRFLSRIALRAELDLSARAFDAWLGEARQAQNPLRDIGQFRQFISSPAAISILDLPFVPIFLVAVFIVHSWLGFLVLAGAGLLGGIALINRLLTRGNSATAAWHSLASQSLAHHSQINAEPIRGLRMQESVGQHWRTLQGAALGWHQRANDPSDSIASVSKTFRLLLQSTILTLGAVLVLRGEISAGMIIASTILANRALAPIDQVISQWRAINEGRAAYGRLRDILARQSGVPTRINMPPPTGRISVHDLTKIAPSLNMVPTPPLLRHVSFDLEPGDGLGVIGKSGAGKSVLARLLVGAWTPDRGAVALDDVALPKWRRDMLARSIGYLPQRVDLLPGTIWQNIARFHPDATDEDVIAAAQLADIHHMVSDLPDGYGTHVGDDAGLRLSGGQLQRVGLARAVLFRPAFLVLDEPNAHLDGAGDTALDAAILDLRNGGSTVVVMAHRPSAIAAMNKVLILENGQMTRFDAKDAVLGPTANGTRIKPVSQHSARQSRLSQ